MKKIKTILFILSCVTLFSSCYVQHPKYSMVEDVVKLETGINVDSVNSILGTNPHDLISLDSLGNMVLLYKYRVREIKRIPVLMKKTKGIKSEGHWKDLLVYVSPEGTVVKYITRPELQLSEGEKKKIDPNEIIQTISLAITIVLPALLVYFSTN